MNEPGDWRAKRREVIEEMRARFDGKGERRRKMSPGDVATIKRFATIGDALVDGVFWSLARPVIDDRCRHIDDDGRREMVERDVAEALAAVLCAYGCAGNTGSRLRFGRWLYEGFAAKSIPTDGAAMRFRQLVAARSCDELAHRLRSLLKLVGAPLDWATLTEDVIEWASGERGRDVVRRKWAQDFYGTLDATEGRDGDRGAARGEATNEKKEAV